MRREACIGGKQLFAERNQCTTPAAGQEAKVPDADEATWQHMQQEAAQELIGRQSQESLLVFMSGVSPAKSNFVIQERDETAIGDCHAMRIGAEVAKHLLRSAEGRFAIDNPSWDEELADETPKQLGLSQTPESAVELKLSGSVGLLERFHKFAAEDLAENPHRKKEIVLSRVYPLRVISRQAAGGHDAVNMRMML
jgi:hypothetical protein